MKLLSERLKWAMRQKSERDRYEIRPADMARSAGVSDATVSNWLKDVFGIKAKNARLLADYLGVNAHWLETGEGEPALDYVPIPTPRRSGNDSVNVEDLTLVMNALRDGEDVEKSMLIEMARTINTRAAIRRKDQ
jgi:transcriptional regulator with XRE-family HTH domain